VGNLHIMLLPLMGIERLLIYSDGLARLDQKMNMGSPSDKTLARIIQESRFLPSSDDISLLEVWMGSRQQKGRPVQPNSPSQFKVETNEEQRLLSARWWPVLNATSYEVVVQSQRGWRFFLTERPFWKETFDRLSHPIEQIAVRAWVGEEIGEWCQPWRLTARTGFTMENPGSSGDMEISTLLIEETPPASADTAPLFVDKPNIESPRCQKQRPPRLVLIFGCLIFALIIAFFSVFWMFHSAVVSPSNLDMPAREFATPIPYPLPTIKPDSGSISDDHDNAVHHFAAEFRKIRKRLLPILGESHAVPSKSK
jgi:hypothetical protein